VLVLVLVSVFGIGYIKQMQWDRFREDVKRRVPSHCKSAECEARFEERLGDCLSKHTVSRSKDKFNSEHTIDDATLTKCLFVEPSEQVLRYNPLRIDVADLQVSEAPLPDAYAHVPERGRQEPDGSPTGYWTYASSELCRGNPELRKRGAARVEELREKRDEDSRGSAAVRA
jgi:hypothetical protein